MVWMHFIILVALSYVMGVAAGLIAKNVRKLAEYWRTNDFIVAFLIVGLVTSTPEITVAINSALQGVPELSLGNLLGASIVLLSLMTGLAAILAGKLTINHILTNQTFFLYLGVIALPAIAISDGYLSRWDGVWLIAAYALFIAIVYRNKNLFAVPTRHKISPPKINLWRAAGVLVAGLASIIIAAYYVVNSALFVAEALHVSPVLVGLLVLSLGTNLPEFALVVTQARNGGKNLVLGDMMSNVGLNVPTLGLLALMSPFVIPVAGGIAISASFLVLAVALFGIFMWSKKVLTRSEGILLLITYVTYAAYSVGHLVI